MPFSNLSGCIAPTQQYVAPPLPSKIEGLPQLLVKAFSYFCHFVCLIAYIKQSKVGFENPSTLHSSTQTFLQLFLLGDSITMDCKKQLQSAQKTSSSEMKPQANDIVHERRSANYKPNIWNYDYLQSLSSIYVVRILSKYIL